MSNTLHHSVASTLAKTIFKLICFNNQAHLLLHVSPKVKLNVIHLKLSMESSPSLGLI